MPGGPGAQNGKGGPKWPELCIKTVIRLCTAGISQNHHPCLLTLPFRIGRYSLFRNVCRGAAAKIIVTPLILLYYWANKAMTMRRTRWRKTWRRGGSRQRWSSVRRWRGLWEACWNVRCVPLAAGTPPPPATVALPHHANIPWSLRIYSFIYLNISGKGRKPLTCR